MSLNNILDEVVALRKENAKLRELLTEVLSTDIDSEFRKDIESALEDE